MEMEFSLLLPIKSELPMKKSTVIKLNTLIKIVIFILLFVISPAYAGDIHDAINKGDMAETKAILKDNPGSLHATDKDGRTPLHLAIIKGNRELAEFLVKSGADVNAKDAAGETPRSYAVKYDRKDIESILIEKNAFQNGRPVPGYAVIQGIESQVPGIHITGHPPNPPESVFRFAYAAAFVLLVLAGLGQFFLNKKFSGQNPGASDEDKAKTAAKHSKIRVFITIMITLLYFILLEGVIQVYVHYHPYQVFIPDPQSHWKVNPAITRDVERQATEDRCSYVIDQQYPYKKAEGTYRILCMGDSQTLGLPWAKLMRFTYPKQLEERLKEEIPGKKIEVMNMGVSGYSSFQGLIYLKNICLRYNPDCIIVAYGYHDGNGSFAPDKDVNTDKPWVKNLRSILYRSQLYLMIRRKILERRAFRKVEGGKPVYRRVSPEDYRKNLTTFEEMGKKNNFRTVFFTVPHIGKEGTSRLSYVEEMRKAAKEMNVPLIDGVEAMSKVPTEEQEKYFYRDGAHFTKEGNEFIARVLAEKMKGIIEGRSR